VTSSADERRQRRGSVVEHTILDATLALLTDRGYEFSVDEVAARARVHKTTIYRRWETKPALVAASLATLAEQDVPVPAGPPLDALEQLAVLVARALRQPAGANALRAAFCAAGADNTLRSTAAQFLTARYRLAVDLILAAQSQGSVREDVDPTLLWQSIVNPLHVNAVLGGALDDRTARALADLALRGAAPRAGHDAPT
jgi:AcrR family transcriptional regulator